MKALLFLYLHSNLLLLKASGSHFLFLMLFFTLLGLENLKDVSLVWNIFWFCCFGLSCPLEVVFYSLWRFTFCISFSSTASFIFGPINLQPLLCTKSLIFKCSKYTQYCPWNKMWAIVQNTQLTPKCSNQKFQDIFNHLSMAFFFLISRLLVSSVNDT